MYMFKYYVMLCKGLFESFPGLLMTNILSSDDVFYVFYCFSREFSQHCFKTVLFYFLIFKLFFKYEYRTECIYNV